MPAWQASRIAKTLPDRWDSYAGEIREGAAFSLLSLFRLGGQEVAVKELVYPREGNTKNLAVDLYSLGTEVERPCVVVVHGGGWNNGDRKEIASFNHWLANRGYAVASIEYRLAPENVWPAPLRDLEAAVKYLKSNADQLGIDRTRIALFGRSAGGQIVTAAASSPEFSEIRGAIAFYAPHDLEFAWAFGDEDDVLNSLDLLRNYMGGEPGTVPANYQSASAYLQEDGALRRVPTLLVHGANDTLVWVEQSRRYSERLVQAGAKSFYLELPWATHGFEFNQNGPAGQLALYSVERFLACEFACESSD
ncbi:alpha/beta hydrolase [Pelagicoccus sp. SDUM812002]|uniref:alpha/beta hydrolase n=1 Tax=Pelagicoccus sp. SDUM812002 TaxID=3041266 RepID=UPI00280D00AD|nr:alpha/beta hydrolase [Pelagicoccus sp. SDUM812002]MDQ8188128.1 alpha/beta hydrolase [Pelagicoccus sp. SDUM812002]